MSFDYNARMPTIATRVESSFNDEVEALAMRFGISKAAMIRRLLKTGAKSLQAVSPKPRIPTP